MWLELDIYQDIEMESTADIKKLKKFTGQRERIFEFLVKLNP